MTKKKNNQGGGSKPHKPTDEQRATVGAMCSYGIPHEEISAVIGIDDKTLRKHYRSELDTASAKANAKVAQRLYKKCIEDGDTASLIFWLKTRAKWSEKVQIDNQMLDKDGNPADHEVSLKPDDKEILQRFLAQSKKD